MDIIEEIGKPAVLEKCAEECMALAHICIKMANMLRDDVASTTEEKALKLDMIEKTADVNTCLDVMARGNILDYYAMVEQMSNRLTRWEKHILEKYTQINY